MKKTIISCAVALICTAAICLTYAFSAPKAEKSVTDAYPAYMSEQQTADYIGVEENILKIMRENLAYFKGAYMSYTYTDDKGEEVTEIVYNKDAVDEAVKKLMNDPGKLNFKYIQEALEKKESK